MANNPETSARADIITAIETVSNVGIVHNYNRWAVTWPDTLELFQTEINNQNILRGWTVDFDHEEPIEDTYQYKNSHYMIATVYFYTIRGYFQLNDADESSITSLAVVKNVVKALNISSDLHDEDSYRHLTPPAKLSVFEPRIFGSVLAHYAEISQGVGAYEAN